MNKKIIIFIIKENTERRSPQNRMNVNFLISMNMNVSTYLSLKNQDTIKMK